MSLATWKRIYYPIDAIEVKPGKPAIKHSLKKWRGLTPSILKRHGLTVQGTVVEERSGGVRFSVDSETCALCAHYIDTIHACATCPLAQTLGKPCDQYNGPYDQFDNHNNPFPMIEALEHTLAEFNDR